MNECVIITKENLQKAYDNKCREVQEVQEDLFPDDLGKDKFCCNHFKTLMSTFGGHSRMIFNSNMGDYYVYPDDGGYEVIYCIACGAKYDGKKWTPKV